MTDPSVHRKLDRILKLLAIILEGEADMSSDLTALEAQVKATTDIEQSAVVLIKGIAAELVAAKADPEKIQALSDALKVSADQLGAAVVANTPAP